MNFPDFLLLSFPGLQPDYLAETESLKSGKEQECKSQTPSPCESVRLIRRELSIINGITIIT